MVGRPRPRLELRVLLRADHVARVAIDDLALLGAPDFVRVRIAPAHRRVERHRDDVQRVRRGEHRPAHLPSGLRHIEAVRRPGILPVGAGAEAHLCHQQRHPGLVHPLAAEKQRLAGGMAALEEDGRHGLAVHRQLRVVAVLHNLRHMVHIRRQLRLERRRVRQVGRKITPMAALARDGVCLDNLLHGIDTPVAPRGDAAGTAHIDCDIHVVRVVLLVLVVRGLELRPSLGRVDEPVQLALPAKRRPIRLETVLDVSVL